MHLLYDLRQALRSVLRSPSYALLCVAVVAFGIGANTAIFSIVYSVILAPLPYPESDRLVFVWEKFEKVEDPLVSRIHVARRNYLEWQKQSNSFSELAAFHEVSLNESGLAQARHVSVASASPNLLPLLGVQPQIGRLFFSNEEGRVAVITDAYFESRFQRDTRAIGAQIVLDRQAYTVVGVLPPRFHLPAMWEGTGQKKPDVWVPLSRLWRTPADDTLRQLFVIGKLKADVPLGQARAEMSEIAKRLGKSDPALNTGLQVAIYPFAVEDTAPTLHQALYVLLGAVGFLLLIACANLANLTLARTGARSREVAVRLALGAPRSRIVTQLIGESLLLSLCGAGVGLLMAHWAIQGIVALRPEELQRPELIEVNLPVFLFALLVSVVTALLFGLAPAIAAARTDINSAVKAAGRSASAGRTGTRQFLIIAEVGLAVILVSGAGLMIRSFREMVNTGIGFRTDGLLAIDIDLPEKRYPSGPKRAAYYQELLARARAIPGVAAASVVDNLPLHRVAFANFHIAGRPDPEDESLLMTDNASASPDYLSMIGMRLAEGRFFTEDDLRLNEKGKDGVVIVNQAWVRKFMNGEKVTGRRILSADEKRSFEIVGVVSDYRPTGAEKGTRPQIFAPDLQLATASLLVRSHGSPEALTKPLQAAVASIDKEIPTDSIETMDGHLRPWLSQRRFNTMLMSVFAGLALLLAMIGVYGVLANMVVSRTREIGIRMAIGAAPAGIAKLILSQSMMPVMVGLALGLAGSLGLSRYLESLLFQVAATDAWSRILAAGAILLVAPAAIYLPLRRAMAVECTVALREE